MRKRIVITAVAVLVIGSVAFGVVEFSGPSGGSVEYHQEQYLKAQRWAEWQQWVECYAPYSVRKAQARRKFHRADFHREALRNLGYWEFREFSLSNHVTEESDNRFWRLHEAFTNDCLGIERILGIRSNAVMVMGLCENMKQWEHEIRKLDVPESAK